MTKKHRYKPLLLLLALLLAVSCTKITKLTDSVTNPSAREIYLREIKGDKTLVSKWNTAYANASRDSIYVDLPYVEKGTFPAKIMTYSYTIAMTEGEELHASVAKDSAYQQIFIDLFQQKSDGFEHVQSNEPGMDKAQTVIKETGNYKVVIQPEVGANTNFIIHLEKKPTYGFPVAGKGNSAILSFWGYERDGGARSHEGVDIFAAHGTPVVAVADGRIGFTGERGLGGKQVWLRTGAFGKSVYYAHLDSILVSDGMSVKIGDTLGHMGNTGNAKGGKPHLHFGIYANGAVDPLPFIYQYAATKLPSLKNFARSFNSPILTVKSANANLRKMPATTGAIIGQLTAGDPITYLGEHKDWLHIQTALGQKAYLHQSLVSEKK